MNAKSFVEGVASISIERAAQLLGVSVDTIRAACEPSDVTMDDIIGSSVRVRFGDTAEDVRAALLAHAQRRVAPL